MSTELWEHYGASFGKRNVQPRAFCIMNRRVTVYRLVKSLWDGAVAKASVNSASMWCAVYLNPSELPLARGKRV